jgi:hypothetical protein
MGVGIHLDDLASPAGNYLSSASHSSYFRESFMKRGKSPRDRYVESDKSSLEDEKELARLLRIFSGRASVSDWEPLVGKEDRQQRS